MLLIDIGSSARSSSPTTELPRSSDEPIGAEPLKSSGTSSRANPLSEGEMMLMPLLPPESVTSLPSPSTSSSSSSSSSADNPVRPAPLAGPSLPRPTSEVDTLMLLPSGARSRSLRPEDLLNSAAALLLAAASLAAACALATSEGARIRLDCASRSTSSSWRPEKSPDGLGKSRPSSSSARERPESLASRTSLAGPAPLSSGERSRSASRSRSAFPMIVLGGRPGVPPSSASLIKIESVLISIEPSSSSARVSLDPSSRPATVGSSTSSRLMSLAGPGTIASSSRLKSEPPEAAAGAAGFSSCSSSSESSRPDSPPGGGGGAGASAGGGGGGGAGGNGLGKKKVTSGGGGGA